MLATGSARAKSRWQEGGWQGGAPTWHAEGPGFKFQLKVLTDCQTVAQCLFMQRWVMVPKAFLCRFPGQVGSDLN